MLSWVREKRGREGKGIRITEECTYFEACIWTRCSHHLVPAEWNMSRAISSLFHQGLVEFPASARMDSSPAIFTVILQTGNVSTEKWSKLSTTTGPLTFITQLIIQDIWLNFHLCWKKERRFTCLRFFSSLDTTATQMLIIINIPLCYKHSAGNAERVDWALYPASNSGHPRPLGNLWGGHASSVHSPVFRRTLLLNTMCSDWYPHLQTKLSGHPLI